MKRYDTYKDSGIEWIGEIPSHWEVKRFKYLFRFVNDKCDQDLPKIGLEHIESWTGRKIENDTEFEGEGTCFVKGDILFGKLRPYLAKVYLADFEGKAVGDFFVFRPQLNLDKAFGHKFLLSRNFIEITNSSTFGSKMPRVSPDFVKELKSILPPLTEQTAIAAYLDRKTAEIDTLIADKKRLLELYEEEKTAIINQAVTKGIDPNAKMKDSGIEWLGEIPEHWEVKKIKHLLKKIKGALKTGPFGSQLKTSDLNPNGKFKVYTQRNVLDNNFEKGEDRIDEQKFDSLKEFLIEYDDILFTSRGTIGKCNVFPKDSEQGILHPCLIRIQIDNRLVLADWILNYANNSSIFLDNVKYESNSTIIDVIYGGTLKEIFLPIPPLEEQQSIVRHIETECARIDAKIEKTKQLIELLTEYRTALISEVVTGKIKVVD